MQDASDFKTSQPRIMVEDALKHLHDCSENQRMATHDSLAGALTQNRESTHELIAELLKLGLIQPISGAYRLTPSGQAYAAQVVRGHRLYETWLAQKTSFPPTDWHSQADKHEHHLHPEALNALADSLGNPRFDPHGDPIPTREGLLPSLQRTNLMEWPSSEPAVITHIEDEPAYLFEKIHNLALCPGSILTSIQHASPTTTTITVESLSFEIPAEMAVLIHVSPVHAEMLLPYTLARLSHLDIGNHAQIHGLSPLCTGAERRRLLDLGIVPGTRISCEFRSPFGSPRCYLIRGAQIALRDYQADRILIHSISPP